VRAALRVCGRLLWGAESSHGGIGLPCLALPCILLGICFLSVSGCVSVRVWGWVQVSVGADSGFTGWVALFILPYPSAC
jgi:hypothetical protein